MKKHATYLVLILVALVAAASPAAAVTTICVTPATITTCPNHTIGAAIAAAGPGDIIKIAAGTFYNNAIVVPAGKDGLQISGVSKTSTIVDIDNDTLLGVTGSTLLGFVVSSRNVTIKNLAIRNGSLGIVSAAPGTIVSGVSFQGQNTAGLEFTSYNGQVSLSEFKSGQIGVLAGGLGTIVKSNTMTNTVIAVDVAADDAQVTLNKITNAVIGIDASADGAQIKSNDVRNLTIGILASGSYPTVQLNKVAGAQVGIETVCSTCFGGTVASNTVTDATATGILISTDAPGLYVQSNTVTSAGVGIAVGNVAGSGDKAVFLVSNKASQIGNVITGHCYSVTGDGNFVVKNSATGCSGSGVRVAGNSNTIDTNTITGTFENGITVNGAGVPYSNNFLNANKTTGNIGQGIAIVGNAAATTVQFNVASANRKDFCDVNANGTTLSGNSFPNPGGAVACPILH